MAYKCVHTKINWSFLILNTEHTSPLNSIPSVTHCSNQWKEVSQNSKPQAQFRESMSEQTHKHCLCEMRAHATRGETQNRGDHDKGKARNQDWLHTLGGGRHGLPVEHRDGNGGLADAILTALGGTAHTLQQEVRVTLDGFHCHMSNPAAWGTWRHESDGKGRETKKQKIKTNNRQKWHEPRHENGSHEANSRQNCSDGRCSFIKCCFKNHSNNNEIQVNTHWPRLHPFWVVQWQVQTSPKMLCDLSETWHLKCKRYCN